MASVPNWLFLGASALCLLPYLYLINLLLIHGASTFRSTYYSLLLSRGIVDVSSILIYLLTTSLREFSWGRDFFWHSQHSYLPTFCYAQVYFFLFAQFISLLLVPVERLLVVFYPPGIQLISSGPSCISSILIWILSLCLAWPMLIQLDCSFDTYENLYLNVPCEQGEAAFLKVFAGCVFVFTTSLTIFAVLFLCRHRIRARDTKDTIFSAFQLIPLVPLLVYLGHSWTRRTVPLRVFEADSPYPVCLALLSFSNVVLLVWDSKIRHKLGRSSTTSRPAGAAI